MKVSKLNILFTAAETGWKLKAHPTARAMSHLAYLSWENVMTNVTRGRWVYSYWPRSPTSYTVLAITAD